MKFLILSSTIVALSTALFGAPFHPLPPILKSKPEEEIISPIDDFVNRYWHQWETAPNISKEDMELYVLKTDLDGNGLDELFLSMNVMSNAKAGYGWEIYVNRGEYYSWQPEYLDFRLDTLALAQIRAEKEQVLLTYFPGGGKSGVITSTTFKDDKFKESVLTRITWERDWEEIDGEKLSAHERILKAFQDRSNEKIVKILVRDVDSAFKNRIKSMPPVAPSLTFTRKELDEMSSAALERKKASG